ncbi:MAG: helix-turn-helix domain-containing protein [Oscillospiraceae bacterium]|jgi:transcriptional regulator with XRE-family HTH domain|nr:helix-turn-helix domain-containing protein [Oscillospiraceae bacterium]
MPEQYVAFGERLRQLRKESGLSQEEFAKQLGTSKQVMSRYETNQRAPKITIVREYAEKLGVSIDYLLGDSGDEVSYADFHPKRKKDGYFYKIFIDVTTKMGLDIPGIIRVTGLTDNQVRTIIFRQMKDAPLPLALRLSDTLGVPLEVWTGDALYTPVDITAEAREVALAYDRASTKDRNTARLALDLLPLSAPAGVDISEN